MEVVDKGKDFYDHYKVYRGNMNFHLANELHNGLFYNWVMLLGPESILEVGAGSGKSCTVLKRLLPNSFIVASDIDQRACDLIKDLAVESKVDINTAVFDVRDTRLHDKSFDLCFSNGLMEHFSIKDIKRGLSEQLRVAKNVIVGVPTDYWIYSNRFSRGDEAWLSKVEWISLFSEVGYIIEVVFQGDIGEEITLMAILSDKFYHWRDYILNVKKEEKGSGEVKAVLAMSKSTV